MAQVVTNTPLVERNARYGRWITTGSLLVILAPLVLTLPALFSGKNDIAPDQLLILYGALLLGLILSNVGGYFLTRWGGKQYEIIANALKGTDKKYRLYNFSLPVQHVLLTPFGATVLLVKNVEGQVYVNQKGWRMNVSILKFLRYFSTESLGDPTKDLAAQEAQLNTFIHEHLGADFNPPVDGLIVFTHPRVSVQETNVDLPIAVVNQGQDALKNALKRPKGAAQLPKADYDKLYTLFEEEAEARRFQAERGLVIAGRKIL